MSLKCYDCDRLPTARQRDICNGDAEMLNSVRDAYVARWLEAGLIQEAPCLERDETPPPRTPAWNVKQPSRGLGDTVAKITTKLGIKPCGGCKKRQAALNKAVPFGRKNNPPQKRRATARPQRVSRLVTRPANRGKHPFAYRDLGTPEFITTSQLMDDAKALASMLPADTSRIVGVSRSGLCAATMVAMLLHRPLSIVRQTQGDMIDAGNGWRLSGNNKDHGRVVVIDDTTLTGNSFDRVLPIVRKTYPDCLSAAIYVNPGARFKPDFYVRELAWPHFLEWNVFNSIITPQMAVDFDGILCHDCSRGDDDDGERYLRFLAETKPRYLIRKVSIPLVVTARLEKYRPQTMEWLRRHGVSVGKLVMGPWANNAERAKADIAAYKAEHFREFISRRHRIKPPVFVESDRRQAERIAKLAHGIVLCPAAGQCFRGEGTPTAPQRRPAPTTLQGPQRTAKSRPLPRRGPNRWAVGITTAPRETPTLARTLASLAAAGFDNIHVFAEPGVDPLPGCTWHQNRERLGGWSNFIQSCRVLTGLDCDVLLLSQDDVLYARNLRGYLETIPWPETGALSVYTSERYSQKMGGGDAWGWSAIPFRALEGSLAIVARSDKIKRLVKNRVASRKQGKFFDALLGNWLSRNGGLRFHYPSLAQHIGETSVVHPGAGNFGTRRASTFVGADFDLSNADLRARAKPPTFQVYPKPATRDLIYHVCALRSNELWRANVRQLTRRWEAFNGRRVVAIAVGEGIHDPCEVRQAFDGYDCEFLEVPNNSDLREVASFLPLLESVALHSVDRAVFYAHTKGNSTADDPRGAAYWRNAAYHALLDDVDHCMQLLETHIAVGIHKMTWGKNMTPPYPSGLAVGNWMLAGTFFWFRSNAIFGRSDWRNIPRDRYGAEAWLSSLFPDHRSAASVFQLWPEEQFPTPNPYDPSIYLNPITDD